MKTKRLVIIDPAFRRGEGHHLAANELLAQTAYNEGFDEVLLLCHRDTPLKTLADERTTVLGIFQTTPYYSYRMGDFKAVADRNLAAKRDFDSISDGVFIPGDMLLVHTINELQLLAMAYWLARILPAMNMTVRLAMMFPAGLELSQGQVTGLNDPLVSLLTSRAMEVLKPLGDRVMWMGIGRTIAQEYAILSGAQVAEAPALVPGIGAALRPKAASKVPNLLLYLGDVKFDKGVQYIPEIVRLLRNSSHDFKSTIQVSGSVIDNHRAIGDAVSRAVSNDARFDMRIGRLSADDYEECWQNAQGVLLAYDPRAYKYKSSGLCWEAMNYAVPSVVVNGTFQHKEMAAYGFAPIIVQDYWPEALFEGLVGLISACASMQSECTQRRVPFIEANKPRNFFAVDPIWAHTAESSLDPRSLMPERSLRLFAAAFD